MPGAVKCAIWFRPYNSVCCNMTSRSGIITITSLHRDYCDLSIKVVESQTHITWAHTRWVQTRHRSSQLSFTDHYLLHFLLLLFFFFFYYPEEVFFSSKFPQLVLDETHQCFRVNHLKRVVLDGILRVN